MIPDIDILYDLGVIPEDSALEEAYLEWFDSINDSTKPVKASPRTGAKFWVILRLPAKDLSNTLEYDEHFEMYLPRKGHGEIWGIATTQAQVNKLVTPPCEEGSSKHVFLVYKIRVKGEEQWGGLLHFLGENKMIEYEN